MRKVLHIRTRQVDPLADDIIAVQRGEAGLEVETFDLTVAAPDYRLLLEGIFQADSVEVW